MNAYAISGANLDAIENNLGEVAKELNGVIENVNSVNDQVSVVEEKVSTIDNELKSIVKEIRETSFVTSARQSIMYNNEQIEKKYGYYDKVRRMSLSLIDSINSSKINKDSLVNLRQNVILNNPNYWLTNAYASLISWILDDKDTCEKELDNALRKNSLRTKLFFMLINLKFDRKNVSLNWLESYIDDLNPLKLDYTFIRILELCVSNAFGYKGKKLILDKISLWINTISNNEKIKNTEKEKWDHYIMNFESRNMDTPYLDYYSDDKIAINDNLFITSSYKKVFDELEGITLNENEIYSIDKILSDVIYDYENEEKEFQDDNFKNKLIIECNGDKTKAEELYNDQKSIYENKTNIIALFDNVVMYPSRFNVSDSTRKIALYYAKNNLKETYEDINSNIIRKNINVNIDDFKLMFDKNTNMNYIKNSIHRYVDSLYRNDDKFLWLILIIINLVGIVGVFFVLSNLIFCTILLFVLLIGNVALIIKMLGEVNITRDKKYSKEKELLSVCEVLYAENVDYNKIMSKNENDYNKLTSFLDNLNIDNYINTSDERNIDIG